MPQQVRIEISPNEQVTAIAYPAAGRRAGVTFILAHGAGANQSSRFMVQLAEALALRGIDTLTFNFLYSEQRKKVPDRNDKLEACWRKVIDAVRDGRVAAGLGRGALAIGGKSMGGRIASQVAAVDSRGLAGLVFLGYPLHPPGQPERLRTRHLPDIRAPMLFVQGTRDVFGTPDELAPFLSQLAAPAELCVVEGGDHSFKVLKRDGRSQAQTDKFVLDAVERWLRARASS
jgi:hypothetical protein